MSEVTEKIVDRRSSRATVPAQNQERRQFFSNSLAGLSPEAQQLAYAIDSYKLQHRRRYIDYEEMLSVIKALGYRKADEPAGGPQVGSAAL